MARRPAVRRKNGYWYSAAGGVGRSFGRCDLATQTQATAALWAALAGDDEGVDRGGGGGQGGGVVEGVGRNGHNGRMVGIREGRCDHYDLPTITTGEADARRKATNPTPPPLSPITVDELASRFLGWVAVHRGPKAHAERSRHVGRFREAFGTLPVVAVEGSHVEAFTASLRAAGHALDYVHKHLVSINAMFRKGVRKGWIPPVSPFASVEPLRLPPKALTEGALPTPSEVKAIIEAADADAHGQMGDVIRLYYHTGARTHELIRARVADFQRSTRQIVLGSHKRAYTMREPKPRTITLNADALAIVVRRCEGRDAHVPIFPRPSDGEPYPSVGIAERFQTVRKRAGVRSSITIYSFRHLWISEALMAGVDAMLVSRMAGTSVKMIETVYGHFRTQSFTDAQARLDAARGR